ncbi:MAG TPA: cupin domain-containing protein [Methanocella sp.]|nr:cupin domain-containing protein [Methanocella sp.]
MQTVRVKREEEFSDRQFYRESPMRTDKIAFNVYDFEPWQDMPMCRHPGSDTILLAVQGDGTMYMDGEAFALEEGEAVYVPAGTAYSVLAGENDMVVALAQGPTPIGGDCDTALQFKCPACGLNAPTPVGTGDGASVTCPRCQAALRLARTADGFTARETGPPKLVEGTAGAPGTAPAERPAGSAGGAEEIVVAAPEGEGLRARVEVPAKIAFSSYNFEPWQVLPMHRNPGSDTILYFAMGQGVVFLEDELESVDDETAVYVPAGATYGIMAGDGDLVVVAMQCPVPVEAEVFGDLGYNCPACDLGTPVTTNTETGCVTVCPRCNVKLKLTRVEDGFTAEETSEPAPASAETV